MIDTAHSTERKHATFRASYQSLDRPCLPAAVGEKSHFFFLFLRFPPHTPCMSRPQPADPSDALMTELATIPNNLGFLVFDLAGKKVHACPQLLTPFVCNAMCRLLHRASSIAPTPSLSLTC